MKTWLRSRSGSGALATFRRRLPRTEDLRLVFAAIAMPVFVWSILSVLREMPSWILRLKTWDLVGVVAYTQAFALFETLAVLTAMIVLAAVLPSGLFRDHFVALGSSLIFIAAGWAIAYHLAPVDPTDMDRRELLLAGLALVGSIALVYIVVTRSARIRLMMQSFTQRISILSFVYAGLGVLGLLIVIIRNL